MPITAHGAALDFCDEVSPDLDDIAVKKIRHFHGGVWDWLDVNIGPKFELLPLLTMIDGNASMAALRRIDWNDGGSYRRCRATGRAAIVDALERLVESVVIAAGEGGVFEEDLAAAVSARTAEIKIKGQHVEMSWLYYFWIGDHRNGETQDARTLDVVESMPGAIVATRVRDALDQNPGRRMFVAEVVEVMREAGWRNNEPVRRLCALVNHHLNWLCYDVTSPRRDDRYHCDKTVRPMVFWREPDQPATELGGTA